MEEYKWKLSKEERMKMWKEMWAKEPEEEEVRRPERKDESRRFSWGDAALGAVFALIGISLFKK